MRINATPPILVAVVAIAAACNGTIGEPGDGVSVPEGVPAGYRPAAATLRRLLSRQYTNAVRDLLGNAAAQSAAPPLDSSLNGLDAIGSAQLAMNDDAVGKYEASARAIASSAMGDTARIGNYLGCEPSGPTDLSCFQQFVTTFGRVAWRRSLASDEIAAYAGLAQKVALELGDFYAGVEYAIATLLESPNFLYMIEIGDPDPDAPSFRRLNGYERASRMSFFLLDTTPSSALLDAAEQGQLDTPEGMRAAAQALIDEDGARQALASFYSEVFKLRDLETTPKDPNLFPQWSSSLAAAMREETLRLIADLVWDRDADVTELYDSDYTFLNGELASLYGVDPPLSDWDKVTLPPEQMRGGLFGQASFLTAFAHSARTSPTLRGKFVREGVMCQSIPSPPPNVVNNLESDPDAKTARDRLKVHQIDPLCAGCHTLMDNVGLGLEDYDAIGAYRTTENGATIDPSGDVQGLGTFAGARQLGTLLRSDPDVAACMVRGLFRQATGHVETDGEAPALQELFGAFDASGHRMKDLLVALVASEPFQFVLQPD